MEQEGACDRRHNVLWDAFGQSEHLSKQGSFNGRLTNGCRRERQRGWRDDGVALAHSKRHKRFQLHTSLSLSTALSLCCSLSLSPNKHINMHFHSFCTRSKLQLSFDKKISPKYYWTSYTFMWVFIHVSIPCANVASVCLPANGVFGCQTPSAISHCDETGTVSITHRKWFFLMLHFHSFWGEKRTKAIILSPNCHAIRRCECSWTSHQESFSQPSKLLFCLIHN